MTEREETERFYVRKLIRNIISRGLYIAVEDAHGIEGDLSPMTRREDEVLAALGMADTDIIYLYSYDAGGMQYRGCYDLTWGCDTGAPDTSPAWWCSDNRLCNSIWSEVFGRERAYA
jgi:hypothetical protein